MMITEEIILNSCVIVNGIAFEVIRGEVKNRFLVTDLDQLNYKASFTIVGNDLVLSSSSFSDCNREKEVLKIISDNKEILMEELRNA